MLKEEYIRQLDSYLYQCYNTTIYSHEMMLVNTNYDDGIGVAECADGIYKLRQLRKNTSPDHPE